ncbi:TonB-dependent receptor [Sandarakinorhabdus oryzae]|uniref:TonB-dependent receptor n=1 Tax=Sandarakinorhabdus oryzae TaxID=2675220 RepID=UPI0012E1DABE|nr:TonB-dependent receptor [Sandarakinorhabdus oryzae]
MKTASSVMAIAIASLSFTTAAFAQTAEAPAPAADVAQAADEGIQEIVVTATKRATNLQQTPISISVLGGAALKERRVQSLLDLADGGVPSLRVATFEARQSALTIGIRGIVPLDANQPAREQGVGVYIDGVYLGRQHGLNAALFDVERIEVLKGPQGTLFGRNTEGGALSIVTKEPTGEFGGNVSAGYGNLGAYTLQAHIDLPAVANIAVKVDVVKQYQDAVTANPLPGQVGWGFFDREGVRVAAKWSPADGISNTLSFDGARDKNSPFYSQLLNYNPNNCLSGGSNTTPLAIPAGSTCVTPGTAFTGTRGTVQPLLPGVVVNGSTLMRTADIGVPQAKSVDETFGITNMFKWKVAPEIEIRSITAWRGVDVEQWDNSGGYHRVPVVAPGCTGNACNFSRYSNANLRQRQFSQELQAVGTIGKVDYVAGLYYFNERVSDDAFTPNSMAIQGYTTAGQTSGYSYVVLNSCTGSSGFGWDPGCRSIDRASAVRSRSFAAYTNVTWNIDPSLHLTVGGRYTKDKKQGALLISRNVNYVTNPTVAAANGYTPLDKTWNRFDPVATLAYDVNDDIHVYAKYASGYRAGGASSRTSNYQAFDPEQVKSYEVGFKSEFFDRRARFNVAAYLMDRTNSQVDLSTIQPTASGNFNNLVTINAPGTTKIRGIEADLTVNPFEGLTLAASYAYTYTDIPLVPVTYVERTSAGVPTGNVTTVPQKFYIVFTPRNAASGSIDYATRISANSDTKVKFHLDANYAQATQTFDQFATKADASFVVNGRISLTDVKLPGDAKLTISAWSRNLFNNQYVYRRDPSNSLPSVQTTAVAGVPNILLVGNNSNVLGDYGNFNMPRTFGVEASVRF